MSVNWKAAEKKPNKTQKVESKVLLDFRNEIVDLLQQILETKMKLDPQEIKLDEKFNQLEENNQKFLENLPIDWKRVEENPSKSYKIENRFLLLLSSHINELKRILNTIKTQS